MIVSLALDCLLGILVSVAIYYAIKLDRRFGLLRNDRQQFDVLLRSLGDTTRRAESGLASLKEATNRSGRDLQVKLKQGQQLSDDLRYLLEKGNVLADRLEVQVRNSRAAEQRSQERAQERTERTQERPQERLRERERAQERTQEREPERAPERRAREPEPEGPSLSSRPEEPVADFPSRTERLLRRVIETRR